MRFLRPHHALFFSLSALAIAGAVNRTIDDEFGDSVTGKKLVYSPSDPTVWKSGGEACGTACVSRLNASRVFRGTWKEAVHRIDTPELIATMLSITATFSGTAVYVYNILGQAPFSSATILPTTATTYLTFELDGAHVGRFFALPYTSITYDFPIYTNTHLADGPHTLVIRVPCGPDNESVSYVLFDYIKYTTSDSSSATLFLPSPIPHDSSVSSTILGSETSRTSSGTSDTPNTVARSPPNATSSLPNTHPPSLPPTSALPPTSSPPSSTTAARGVSHRAPIAIIVGGAVGGAAFLVIAGTVLARLVRRARKRARAASQPQLQPPRPDVAASPNTSTPDSMHPVVPARWSRHPKFGAGPGLVSVTPLSDFGEAGERARGEPEDDLEDAPGEPEGEAENAQRPAAEPEVSRPRSAAPDEARLRALEETVSRMQMLIEAPPRYTSQELPEGVL